MSPTENLKNEHKEINELLKIMSKIAGSIKSNKVFYTSDVEDIIEYMEIFIEKSHHGKEEIYYTKLELYGVLKDTELLNEMLHEHTRSRNYLKDICTCVVNCKIGYTFSGDMLAESLTNYVLLIENHMLKEEDIIFPLADIKLSDENQHEISIEFDKIEESIVKHGFQDHYHTLLKNLQTKYPE
jgi:hemerythrin-like domain-containing protein